MLLTQNLGNNFMGVGKTSDLNFPFDFCRIERASRILKCDCEDILNWAVIGEIKIYLPFFKQEIALIHLSVVDVERLEEEGILIKKQGRFFIELDKVSRLVIDEKEFEEQALKYFCDDSMQINAFLEGYWPISGDQLRVIYFENKNELEYYEIFLMNLNIMFGLSLPTPVQVKKPINISNMYLSKKDAIRIHKHLDGQLPFSSIFNYQEKVTDEISPKSDHDTKPNIQRLRIPTAQLIKGLLQLQYGVDNPILDRSPKLHEDLSQKFASSGIEANIMQLRAFENLMVKIRDN